MFILNLEINNYGLFKTNDNFKINNFNIPDNENEGSGLNILVGENGCGKTTILDAISSAMLDYKADAFKLTEINNIKENTEIIINSDKEFNVNGIFPKSNFDAIGFKFVGKIRNRVNKSHLLSPVVSEQYYISKNPDKPAATSPELRVNVPHSFGSKRYNEKVKNIILYKDRTVKDFAERKLAYISSSDKVYETVLNKECVNIYDRVTPLDFWVCILAFTFDLNFDVKYNIVKENDYINILIDRFDYKDKETKSRMENIRNIVNKFIDEKI